jgi:hypothetical protein
MGRRPAQSSLLVLLTSAALCAPLLVPVAPATAETTAPPSFEELCSDQVNAFKAVKGRITAHNAQPHQFELPRQARAYQKYNSRAASLVKQQERARAKVLACAEAMTSMKSLGLSTLDLMMPSRLIVSRIGNTKARTPSSFRPPPPPARGDSWTVPPALKPLYEALRGDNPARTVSNGYSILQGKSRPIIGQLDPAYPVRARRMIGRKANSLSKVSPDHIIPLPQIMQLPGFLKLTPRNMYLVVNAPINLQWLSNPANTAKSSRSVQNMLQFDANWRRDQVRLEDRVLGELKDLIQKLLKSQV